MAKVLVNASGLNSRPAWPLSAKIGRNATVMMSSEKKIGGPTSCAAAISTAVPVGAGRRGLEVLVRVLDQHDRGIDHGADRDRDTAEAHDVRS